MEGVECIENSNSNSNESFRASRNAFRRKKKKLLKSQTNEQKDSAAVKVNSSNQLNGATILYSNLSNENDDFEPDEDLLKHFRNVVNRFRADESLSEGVRVVVASRGEVLYSDDDDKENQSSDESDIEIQTQIGTNANLQKRKAKDSTISVSQLKQIAPNPSVVEWHDVSSSDPVFLVSLKSAKNSVPVPDHWSNKHAYLSHKRGIETIAYQLPDYIEATGILQMMQQVKDKESDQTLKSKMRERVRPRMGKLDVDYQKLHDAFFKSQTKPKLTGYGKIYSEGRSHEFENIIRRPGQLSDELIQALDMMEGGPPPWLVNMQRFGPPPSYPGLLIPGLNCPIPEGAQWGYQPGGWGKPPVDEFNRPLYGDIFGLDQPQSQSAPTMNLGNPIVKSLWGEFDPEYEEEGTDEENENNTDEVEMQEDEVSVETTQKMNIKSIEGEQIEEFSMATDYSIPSQVEHGSPDDHEEPGQLYRVIPQISQKSQGFMGSRHGYDLTVLNNETHEKNVSQHDSDLASKPDDSSMQKAQQDRSKNKDSSISKNEFDRSQRSKVQRKNNPKYEKFNF